MFFIERPWNMSYHMDDQSMSLDDLQERLEASDLIPSRQPLVDGIRKQISSLKKAGILSVAALRARLKNAKSIASLASEAAVDSDYLILLRREVEGYFPKPLPLKEFNWMEKESLAKLEAAGIKNTEQLYSASLSRTSTLSENTRLSENELSKWLALADLSRIQWVSPTVARVLIAAGFNSSALVEGADPEALFEAIQKANEGAWVYKGKIGLRDIKRLIAAAAYVPQHTRGI
jgi:hypothetical protein